MGFSTELILLQGGCYKVQMSVFPITGNFAQSNVQAFITFPQYPLAQSLKQARLKEET
jgi:hypothetical protein